MSGTPVPAQGPASFSEGQIGGVFSFVSFMVSVASVQLHCEPDCAPVRLFTKQAADVCGPQSSGYVSPQSRPTIDGKYFMILTHLLEVFAVAVLPL